MTQQANQDSRSVEKAYLAVLELVSNRKRKVLLFRRRCEGRDNEARLVNNLLLLAPAEPLPICISGFSYKA